MNLEHHTECPLAAEVIACTQQWVLDVVIACNFCPFASKVMRAGKLHYQVEFSTDRERFPVAFWEECQRLDARPDIDTTLLIFPHALESFDDYLGLVEEVEELLVKKGYEGVYQVASFHPLYRFADSAQDDAANYTNRSIYPMLHLLREDQMEEVIALHPDAEQIPYDNIHFARNKGTDAMRALRDACTASQE